MSTEVVINLGLQVPSLHPTELESTAISPLAESDPSALKDNSLVKRLLEELNKQPDLVIDFSSLKTCLNPLGIEDAQSEEPQVQ